MRNTLCGFPASVGGAMAYAFRANEKDAGVRQAFDTGIFKIMVRNKSRGCTSDQNRDL